MPINAFLPTLGCCSLDKKARADEIKMTEPICVEISQGGHGWHWLYMEFGLILVPESVTGLLSLTYDYHLEGYAHSM